MSWPPPIVVARGLSSIVREFDARERRPEPQLVVHGLGVVSERLAEGEGIRELMVSPLARPSILVLGPTNSPDLAPLFPPSREVSPRLVKYFDDVEAMVSLAELACQLHRAIEQLIRRCSQEAYPIQLATVCIEALSKKLEKAHALSLAQALSTASEEIEREARELPNLAPDVFITLVGVERIAEGLRQAYDQSPNEPTRRIGEILGKERLDSPAKSALILSPVEIIAGALCHLVFKNKLVALEDVAHCLDERIELLDRSCRSGEINTGTLRSVSKALCAKGEIRMTLRNVAKTLSKQAVETKAKRVDGNTLHVPTVHIIVEGIKLANTWGLAGQGLDEQGNRHSLVIPVGRTVSKPVSPVVSAPLTGVDALKPAKKAMPLSKTLNYDHRSAIPTGFTPVYARSPASSEDDTGQSLTQGKDRMTS